VYGTADENSDTDIRGIWLPSIDQSLSMKELKDIKYVYGEEDVLIFPLQKFFKLALKCNPSVFEWMFVPKNCIIIDTPASDVLVKSRGMFLSQEIYHRFKGYAWSEFSSITKLSGPTGEKRKQQILKYGYSPKNGMNCIRLIEQAIELLTEQTIHFPRPNAEELLGIKHGEWPYQKVVQKFNNLLEKLEEAKEKTTLPEKADFDYINEFMVFIIKEYGK
jgi:predicted nucleotidyltransferase